MKKSTMNLAVGSLLSAGGAAIAVAAYRKKQNESILEDKALKESEKVDQVESVDAEKDKEEKGLSQLDSAYRSEWIANGFPQTHQEMKELEEEEKKNTQ